MAFQGKRCKAIVDATGQACNQPAVAGGDFCRFHSGEGAAGEPNEETEVALPAAPGGSSGRLGNRNALKHGAYSIRLLPEEEPVFEAKRQEFTEALGATDVFDREIVRLLALISTKVDFAVMRGAEHSAYGGMIKQILDLMKELKATRASRDPVAEGPSLTYADLVEALRAWMAKRDAATGANNGALAVVLDPTPRECPRCCTTAPLMLNYDGQPCCSNCGLVVELDAPAVAALPAVAVPPAAEPTEGTTP